MQASEQEVGTLDRKMRLTASTSPERRHRPTQSDSSSSSSTSAEASSAVNMSRTGSSHNTVLDTAGDSDHAQDHALPSPATQPPTRRDSRNTVPSNGRRQSDIVLPKWQPDADVTRCPVCNNQFTFWYRKHHCRKCGRVVCANCSPHRITIPRQFIVRPPEPPSIVLDLTGETSPTTPTTPVQLWGGEEVRVCNPCVPDPNFSPPPQQQPPRSPDPILPEHWRFPTENSSPPIHHPASRRMRNSSGPLPPAPPLPPHIGHRPTLSDASSMSSDHHRRFPQGPFLTHRGAFPAHLSVRDIFSSSESSSAHYPPRTSSAGATGSSSSTHPPAPSRPYHNPPLIDINTSPPPAVQRRRQIPEEDECPICSEELPPKGPNGETTDRERHVEDCIAMHSYTSTPPSRAVSAPPDGGEGASSVSGSRPAAGPPASLPSSSSAPLRHRRMTGGRMLVYKATEKDCVAEDGTEAECVICFEEFEPGDEMGRLECLCRFHRACIRQWWDTKGAGSCPTHQLHD
ncbi:uncharacterized protein PV09_00381 [Verruconis gallopava]|uniref:RING-type E3 ubiquitin transferase n=1 Tax=Verruconis gallopava TaxID=253628 RepID=A0A0D2ASR4_9PEZI|nr:uncharacterized protein PV09_00381 [Verruconis gallopava]KIW09505.1 hypothetical protein PV09_00381 [Verruconis gallopava]